MLGLETNIKSRREGFTALALKVGLFIIYKRCGLSENCFGLRPGVSVFWTLNQAECFALKSPVIQTKSCWMLVRADSSDARKEDMSLVGDL